MSAPSPLSDGNRKDPRARVLNMTVRYRSATVDEFIENHSHDISRGGMFIKTRSPFPAGTLLKFEVRIAEDQKLMHGVGRVVWRREPATEGTEPPAGMGIKFIKTGEGAAALIGQLVAARKGEQSNFEAGVRTDDATPLAPSLGSTTSSPFVEAVVPPFEGIIDSTRATQPPPEDTGASLDFESSGREAEILVSSPPKPRVDHSPEKRKVVLKDAPAKPAPAPKESLAQSTERSSSEPPATLPPRAQRAPESSHGAAVTPEVARAALEAAETPKKGPGAGAFLGVLVLAAGAWVLLNSNENEKTLPSPAATPNPPVAPKAQAAPLSPPNRSLTVQTTERKAPATANLPPANSEAKLSSNSGLPHKPAVVPPTPAIVPSQPATTKAVKISRKSNVTVASPKIRATASKRAKAPSKPTAPKVSAPSKPKVVVTKRPVAAKPVVSKPVALPPKKTTVAPAKPKALSKPVVAKTKPVEAKPVAKPRKPVEPKLAAKPKPVETKPVATPAKPAPSQEDNPY